MIDLYTNTRKTYAKTSRILLDQLSELMDCSGACDECVMGLENEFRRPDCLFDLVLPRLLEIEEE